MADLYIRARHAATDFIPPLAHADSDVRQWIATHLVPRTETWVAEDERGSLVGLLSLDGEWVEQLYVEPSVTGRGVGTELLGLAKSERSDGLRLWTFASNTGAQRFYQRHGFAEAGRTDGDNEEGAPDILYVWPGETGPSD